MKKCLLSVITICVCAFGFAAGDTIFVNSKTVTCNYYGKQSECLQYKRNLNDTAWKVYSGNIRNFKYNPGYFYTLTVRRLENPQQWGLVKVVSKTKSTVQQQPGDSITAIIKPPAALIGNWNYTRLTSDDGEGKLTKEFLRFDATELRVTGRASCNGFFGNYTLDSTKGQKGIHFEALGHTMMACENLATENKLLKAMELVDKWTVSGTKLYLKAGNKTLIELTKAPAISPNGGGNQ